MKKWLKEEAEGIFDLAKKALREVIQMGLEIVRTDLANRPTEPMLVSYGTRYTKLWGNCGFLQSGSRQTTPVHVGVTCGSGISVVQVGRE